MNKIVAVKMKEKAEEICKKYSDPKRELNTYSEVWVVESIVPLSESTAVALFQKSKGKKAFAFMYWVNMKPTPYVQYFIPTESHVFGMTKLTKYLQGIEEHNFKQNFGG